jgi:spore coat protein CotF
MPFGAHETMEVHEILNEKMNLIQHFSMYAQQVQDRSLRQMLDRHIQTACQSYDQLVSYTHDYAAASGMKRTYSMPNVQPQQIQYGLHNPAQQTPQMQGSMNDQQILASMLSCHKNSARNHMHSSLECADPNVRQMLINGAITCANQAYEVFVFMNQQGYYQVPTMNDHTAKTFLHAYQPMNESMPMRESAQSGAGMGSSMNQMNQMGTAMGGMNAAMSSNMNNMGMNTQTSGLNKLNQMGSGMNNMSGLHNMGGSNIQQ